MAATAAPTTDRARALAIHHRLGGKLQALYAVDTAVNSRRGAEVGNPGERPTPMSSALLDLRAYAQEALGRLEHLVTTVLTGGDPVGSVSGWWGEIRCPACDQDTLLLDVGARWVSCTNPDCDDGGGEAFSDHQQWLERRSLELGYEDGTLTVNQRQLRRIQQLEAEVVTLRDTLEWPEAEADETLTDPSSAKLLLGHRPHVCPETGGEDAR